MFAERFHLKKGKVLVVSKRVARLTSFSAIFLYAINFLFFTGGWGLMIANGILIKPVERLFAPSVSQEFPLYIKIPFGSPRVRPDREPEYSSPHTGIISSSLNTPYVLFSGFDQDVVQNKRVSKLVLFNLESKTAKTLSFDKTILGIYGFSSDGKKAVILSSEDLYRVYSDRSLGKFEMYTEEEARRRGLVVNGKPSSFRTIYIYDVNSDSFERMSLGDYQVERFNNSSKVVGWDGDKVLYSCGIGLLCSGDEIVFRGDVAKEKKSAIRKRISAFTSDKTPSLHSKCVVGRFDVCERYLVYVAHEKEREDLYTTDETAYVLSWGWDGSLFGFSPSSDGDTEVYKLYDPIDSK